MARNYAALPHEYLEEMAELSDEEFGRLCRALLAYSSCGEAGTLEGTERVVWPRVKMQEDRFQSSYKDTSRKRSDAGKSGASRRWAPDTAAATDDGKPKQDMANDSKAAPDDGKNGYTKTKTETETNTETNTPSSDGVDKPRAKRFTPPTVEQVAAYVRERRSSVDPQEFVDFYASKGWMVGKTPMKDWKAACRNAEKWDRWNKAQPQQHPSAPPDPKALERVRKLYGKVSGNGP